MRNMIKTKTPTANASHLQLCRLMLNPKFLILSLTIVLFASCKSGKMAMQSSTGVLLTTEQRMEAIADNTPVFDSFSSRLRMTVPLKKGEYTLNGTLKMQRDQLIQISLLLPIIRTEAARIEISPERILVIDRMNKRYASVPVSELREVFHTEVDFAVLQSLFSNSIFVPGANGTKRPKFHASSKAQEPDVLTLIHQSREFIYSFFASIETNRLVGSSIETHSSKYGLQWKYANFVAVGETTFPAEMTILIGKKKDQSRTTMELSRLSMDKQTITPTPIPTRYEEIGLNDILKILEKL